MEVWALDQAFDFSPFDDLTGVTEVQDGLPEFSIKSETLMDTQMDGLLDICPVSNEGFLGSEWMEESDLIQLLGVSLPDDSSYMSPALQLDDLSFSIPATAPLTTTTTSPAMAGEVKQEMGAQGHVFADEFLQSLHKEPVLKEDSPPSSPSSSLDQVAPEIVFDTETGSPPDLLEGSVEFLHSPLSPGDVESVLSSSACSLSASPSPSPSSPSTIDSSSLYSDSSSLSYTSTELFKVVANLDKTPYSRPPKSPKSVKSKGRKQTASIGPNLSHLEMELLSKKDRKKLQNKNAAIRYRQKKKVESDQQKTEVEELESINVSLREKCEELQREVKCMKDLINDIRKARGLAALSLSQSILTN